MDESKIKTILKSLIVSDPYQMTVSTLNESFRQVEGYDIPFRKLGYSKLEDFLLAIPDCLVVIGTGPHAEVQGKVSSKSSHIADLVANQKLSRTKRSHPMRRAMHIFTDNKPKFQPPRINFEVEEVEECEGIGAYVILGSDNECDITAGFDFELDYKIPFEIQNNLKMLISTLKDGLWMKNLAHAYWLKFHYELDFLDCGYESLPDMILTLTNIFNFKRTVYGSIKLYDKSIVPPETLFEEKKDYVSINHFAAFLTNSHKNMLSDDCVKIPTDVMKLGETIARQNLSRFEMNDYIKIRIGEIYDPSKFWFNLNDGANGKSKLDDMMDEMQKFYATRANEYEIPRNHLEKGLHCAIKFMDKYHRAKILSFASESKTTLKAFFFDCGSVSAVSSHGVLFLHNTFKTLPMQAIRGRLSRICPRYIHEQWSRESASRFLEMVKSKVLLGQIDYIEEKRNAYQLRIMDKTGPEHLFISDQLVKENYAILASQDQEKNPKIKYKPIVKYLHLFPTYDELELGIVPTAGEMLTIMNYYTIESIYPLYFEKEPTNKEEEVSDVGVNKYYCTTNSRLFRELKKPLEETDSTSSNSEKKGSEVDVNEYCGYTNRRLLRELKKRLEERNKKAESSLSESLAGVDDKTTDAVPINCNYECTQISPGKLLEYYNQPQLPPQIPTFPIQQVPEFISNPVLSPPILMQPLPGFAPLQPNPCSSFLLNPPQITLNPYAPPFQGANLYFNPQPNMMVYYPQQTPLNVHAANFEPKEKGK